MHPVPIGEYLARNPVSARILQQAAKQDTLWGAYGAAAGEPLASRTLALALDSEVLVIGLDSSEAMAEARLRERTILEAVASATGRPIRKVKIRLAA